MSYRTAVLALTAMVCIAGACSATCPEHVSIVPGASVCIEGDAAGQVGWYHHVLIGAYDPSVTPHACPIACAQAIHYDDLGVDPDCIRTGGPQETDVVYAWKINGNSVQGSGNGGNILRADLASYPTLWQHDPDGFGASGAFDYHDYLLLSIQCQATAACPVDGSVQSAWDIQNGIPAGQFCIDEIQQDHKPIRGDFTAQLITGQGGTAVGPETKSLTVCTGSWVRLRVKNIHDADYNLYQDRVITDTSPLPRRCDGWDVKIDGYLYDYSNPNRDLSIANCYVDIHCTSSGQSVHTCRIEDTSVSYTPCEYLDEAFQDSVLIEVTDLECEDSKTQDKSGSGGCSTCGGGSGAPVCNLEDGSCDEECQMVGPGPLRVCGTNATWKSDCCECYFFHKTANGWVCDTDPTIKLSVSGSDTTITLADGTVYTFTGTGAMDGTGVAIYYPSKVADPDGAETLFGYDAETGQLISVTDSQGRVTEYGHDGGNFNPTWVKDPDGIVRTIYEYGGGYAAEKPVKVWAVDPDSRIEGSQDPPTADQYTNKTSTTYDYLVNGQVLAVTSSSGMQAHYEYDGQGRVTRTCTVHIDEADPENHSKVYDCTDYAYDDAELDYDSQTYGVTIVHRYADTTSASIVWASLDPPLVGSIDIDGSDRDIVSTHYYYASPRYLRAIRTETGGGTCLSEVVNTYDSYGNILTSKQLRPSDTSQIKSETDYEYYDTATTYVVPVDQYSYSGPNDVPYQAGTGVSGNGLVRTVTFKPNANDSYTTTYRYYVNASGIMTPFVTLTKDQESRVTKNVVNPDGSVSEFWEENDQSALELVRSMTYYQQSDQTAHPHTLGMLKSETAKNVATSGANRDMLTEYTYVFDSTGETTTATCGGKSTVSHYNRIGQLAWDQDDQERQTDYGYDWRGAQVVTWFPQVTGDSGRKMIVNSYSPCCGLLDWTQDENGNKTHYDYDAKGRVVKTWTDLKESGSPVQSSTVPLVKYVYDDADFGRQTQVITRSDSGVNDERTMAYTYDDAGRVTKIVYPYASTEGDLLGSDEFLYDEFGRLMLKRDGNSKITAYAYDDLGRLTEIDYEYTGDFELPIDGQEFSADTSYGYDGISGRVLSVTDSTGTSGYTYDRRGRIKTYTPALPAGYGIISYEYNGLGQKTAMTVPLGVSNKGRRYEYSYDNTGKQTGMSQHPATVTSNTTLSSVTGDNQTHFTYDDAQNRVKMQTKAGDVYYFVYDPTASIPAVVYEQGTEYRYLNVREPEGSLVSREKYDGTARVQSRTYHFDGLGSTIALTDETGATTDNYAYDAWGNVTSHTGPGTLTTDNPYQYVGQFGYYTHHQEPTFGLLQLGVRYYDPGLGRFTERDPIADGLNWYQYAESAPTNLVDPTGLSSIGDWFDDWSQAWLDALGILNEWIRGQGGHYREYGPWTIQTEQIRKSIGVSRARAEANRKCHKDVYGGWNTSDAAGETFLLRGGVNATVTQVGAYMVEYEPNCQRRTIRYRVTNSLTVKSFFYHLTPDRWNRTSGPMATINQKFWWDEPMSARCARRCRCGSYSSWWRGIER